MKKSIRVAFTETNCKPTEFDHLDSKWVPDTIKSIVKILYYFDKKQKHLCFFSIFYLINLKALDAHTRHTPDALGTYKRYIVLLRVEI